MSISGAGGDFDILAYAASGMAAQRGALEVGARNIALAQTATPDHPVKAYEPVYSAEEGALDNNPFASLVRGANGSSDDSDITDDDSDSDDDGSDGGAWASAGVGGGQGMQGLVAMTGVTKSNSDVNPITQMLDMINAQRAYESNASVFDLGKSVASKTIDLENTQ